VAGGDRDARERAPQRRRDAPLVLRVSEREQEGDRHRLGGERASRGDDPLNLGIGERLLSTPRSHALGHTEHVATGDERGRVVARQVIQRRAVLSPEPQQVLEAARRQEHYPRAAPLEQRVGRDRGAVHQQLDGRRPAPFPPPRRLDRPKHAYRRILRRRDYLAHVDLPVFVDCDKVGERAPDVDAYPHGPHPSSMWNAECGVRS